MTLSPKTRWRFWIGGLAVAAILAAKSYTDYTTPHVSKDPPRLHNADHVAVRGQSKEGLPQLIALDLLHRSALNTDTGDLFRPKSWYVPPTPPPPAPPPAPQAPPLPFTFLGKVREPSGKLTIFLSDNNRVYLVHGGETLRHQYHVDGVKNGKLALTYLPLKKRQYLNLAGTH